MHEAGRQRECSASCKSLAGEPDGPISCIGNYSSNECFCVQTRVYEKLRFDRVRQSQLSGEDLRNRWHNALKHLNDGEDLDPDDIKIKVGLVPRATQPIDFG